MNIGDYICRSIYGAFVLTFIYVTALFFAENFIIGVVMTGLYLLCMVILIVASIICRKREKKKANIVSLPEITYNTMEESDDTDLTVETI